MAMARKCDRCGKFYEHYATKPVNANGRKVLDGLSDSNGFLFTKRKENSLTHFIEDDSRDLCPDCFESLLAWFYEKRGADNG